MFGVIANNLVVTRGGFPAIAKGDFELPASSFALVTGENGSGKTTLLKAISGISILERGEISLDFGNGSVNSKDPRKMRRVSAYLGHNTLYVRHILVGEHLELTATLDLKPDRKKSEFQLTVKEAIEIFNLKDKLNVRVENLSAGQQRRLHLASTLIRSTPLLCVDEPHASLDEKSKAKVDEIIAQQFSQGRSLIVATHDPNRLREHATHEIKIINGTCKIEKIDK